MNKRIAVFNVIYYAVIFLFIAKGRDDPSSSLGYGYFILIFWIVAAIMLIILLIKGGIRPKSFLDKIGVFTATPILSIAFITVILLFQERVSSEWYFNKGDYRFKVLTYNYKSSSSLKRIEFYRNVNTLSSGLALTDEAWVKDSTWIYLSQAGDTVKKVKYENNVEIK